ncbi:MAG: serine/threonine protein kinase [Planctomycetes bacterium]|nr:serine/threonine protein kinase [Planctomycetota bacterium]
MDSGPSDYAAEHARAVAREVVAAGLAPVETVRRHFQEYGELLGRIGPRGTFSQLLLVRGAIDRAGFDRLQAAVPPDPARLQSASAASQVFRLPPGQAAGTSEQTAELSNVVSAPDDDVEALGGSTMVFQRVIAPPPGLLDSDDPEGGPSLEALVGGGLESGDELALPVLAPPARTPEPPLLDAETVPSSDVLDLPLSLVGDAPRGAGGPRVRSTTDSRTPGSGATGALGLGSGGFALGPASADDLAGEELSLSSEEAAAPVPEPQPGAVLGGHELLRVLGRGGMGVIYTARRQGQDEVVALKVLLGVNDPGVERRRQRFRCEFEALRRLDHPNIVRVHDYGREGSYDWYTMTFVEGKDFERLLLEGALEPQERLEVFHDVCDALAHAHERSVVHRDVKPQNVLVDAQGRGHVLDFGLAKLLDQGGGMTRTGSTLGTPYYMAPEQLKSAKHIDARADVFALGVMLYEIVVGQRPFLGETAAEVGQRILNDDPVRPSKVKKAVHPDLDAICLKALEKDPERRYADAGALLEDLRRHKKGLGAAAAKEVHGLGAEVRRWAARNRAGLIGGLVASVVLVPAFLVVVAMTRPERPVAVGPSASTEAPPPVEPTETTTPPEPPPEPATTTPGPTPTPEPTPPPEPPPTPEPTPPTPEPTPPTPEPTPPAPEPTPPTPEPTPPTPEPASPTLTPVEAARAALVVPLESAAASGADQAENAHRTPAARRALVLGLEARVLAPMAQGALDRAVAGAQALRAVASLQVSELVAEVERDAEALRGLRALAGARVAEDPRRLRVGAEVYGGERLRVAPGEAAEGGWLRLGPGLLDPLALELSALRQLVVDPAVDHPGARYALAALGLYRGLDEQALEADLAAAGDAPAAARRRKLAAWLAAARAEVWRALEDEAEAAWRELHTGRRTDAQLLAGLDDYVKAHGRTAAFRARREEWVRAAVERRSWPDLVAGVQRRGQPQVTWKPLARDAVLDFEAEPVDPARPFRVEAQTSAVAVENARVAFDLDDLVADTAQVELGTRASQVVAFLGPFAQEIEADGAWTVKAEGRVVGNDPRKRPMTTPRPVIFDRNDTDRVFRLAPQSITMPLADAARLRGRDPALGAQALGDLRLAALQLAWRPDENERERAQRLTRRLVERRLVERLVDDAGKDSHVLCALDPARPTALVLDGPWEAGGDALVAGAGAAARLAAWADTGTLRLRLALDDGPGARLVLRPTNATSGGAVWPLPGLLNPDPERFREVVVRFDLRGKAVSVVVDGVRLRNPPQLPQQGAVFGLELVGRTKGRLRDVELTQAVLRSGLRP